MNVMKLLLRRRGIADDSIEPAPPSDTELPELDLPPEEGSVAKLRDDSPDSSAAPASDPAEWRQPGQPSAPPSVQGDDEQHRQVWEYLRGKMAQEADPEGRERRRTGNALLVAAGRNPTFEVDPKHGVSSELLQYLSLRNRDDASERAAGQRAADSESRAKLAEQRFGLDESTKRADLLLKQLEADRKQRADEAGQPLRDAKTRESEARAGDLAAKTKARTAAATGAGGGTTDIVFDGDTLNQVRGSPNKTVNADQQKKVAEKAADWGLVVKLSESLASSLDEWARTPGQSARNQVLLKVTMSAQSLTRALGGGAMAEHEKGLAFNALGGQLTDPLQLSNLLSSVAGDDAASARAAASMSERARTIRPLAHEMIKGFAQGYGYEVRASGSPAPQAAPSPAPQAPSTQQAAAPQASADKVPMISVASGKTVMLSASAAAELEKSGKVRKP
jgi:hypothetical protein